KFVDSQNQDRIDSDLSSSAFSHAFAFRLPGLFPINHVNVGSVKIAGRIRPVQRSGFLLALHRRSALFLRRIVAGPFSVGWSPDENQTLATCRSYIFWIWLFRTGPSGES